MSGVPLRSPFAPGRFRMLLAALLVSLVGSAAAAGFPAEHAITGALIVLVILAAVYDLAEPRERRWSGALATVAVVLIALAMVVRIRHLPVIRNATVALFEGLVVWRAYASVMRRTRPAPDRIVGAICVYILIGLTWAKGYEILDGFQPGSFRIPADTAWAAPGPDRYLYLSFVTLATVGYGDITPMTPLAGTLAWLEAITGQLYLAITIAQLVSLSQVNEPANEPNGPPPRS